MSNISIYEPDVWQVLEVNSPSLDKPLFKVLAGWYGGYTGCDSWKINSGITHCEYDDNFWYFYGYSGSVYKCHKSNERMSSLTYSIFNSLSKGLDELNNGSSMKIIYSFGENHQG